VFVKLGAAVEARIREVAEQLGDRWCRRWWWAGRERGSILGTCESRPARGRHERSSGASWRGCDRLRPVTDLRGVVTPFYHCAVAHPAW